MYYGKVKYNKGFCYCFFFCFVILVIIFFKFLLFFCLGLCFVNVVFNVVFIFFFVLFKCFLVLKYFGYFSFLMFGLILELLIDFVEGIFFCNL